MLRSDWFCTLRRNVAFGGIALAFVLAFTLFRPAGTPGPVERDFEAYYAAGVTLDAGADPYSRAIWPAETRVPGVSANRDELLPFVGPPALLPFWALLGRLPYRVALTIWTIVLVGALLMLPLCVLRLTRAPRDPWLIGGTLAMTVAAAPTIGGLALGQAALVSAAAVAAAIIAYRARTVPAALGATFLAAVQPNLALALIGRIRSRWDAAVAASAALAFTGLTLALGGGPTGLVAYGRRLGAHGDAERFITIQHTPAAVAYAFGAPPSVALACGTLVTLVAVVATVTLAVRERLGATTATLLCCAALPLAVPFFHEHDFVLEMLPLLVLAIGARGRARGLAAIAAVLILVDWFGLAQRHAAQGQIVCLGAAVACAFIVCARKNRRTRWDLAGLATLALVAAIAVPLGRMHPAPTWPDDLPATYRAGTGDISAVWADEARATGLNAVEPVWGALRSLPLAGSIVLGIALIADARNRRRRSVGPGSTDTPESGSSIQTLLVAPR